MEQAAVIRRPVSQPEPMQKSGVAIPLTMVRPGTPVRVADVRGKDSTRQFLQNLGFVPNAELTVISDLSGNLIVGILGARVAVSKAMANRILTVEGGC